MKTRYSYGGDEHIFVEMDEEMSLAAFFKSMDSDSSEDVTSEELARGLKLVADTLAASKGARASDAPSAKKSSPPGGEKTRSGKASRGGEKKATPGKEGKMGEMGEMGDNLYRP